MGRSAAGRNLEVAGVARVFTAVLVAALLLGGCAVRAGDAALVDGEPITEQLLAETVADLAAISEAPPRNVLQALIVNQFWLEAAGEAGLGASEQEGRALLDELVAESAGEPGREYSPGIVAIARVLVAQRKAAESGQELELALAAAARLAEADIEVSPRYGAWSGDVVAPVLPAWLVGGSS